MTIEERIYMLVRENGVISLEDLAVQMGEAKIVIEINHPFKEKVFKLIHCGKIKSGWDGKLRMEI